MLVSELKAEPNAHGGRIDLSWTNPIDNAFAGVKILRRETAFPGTGDPRLDKEIGDLAAAQEPAGESVKFVDVNLKNETVYYYAVVPYDAGTNLASPSYVSAMTTTPYRTAAHLYNNLPAFYRRYDTKLAPDIAAIDPADRQKGQLQRFIDMFGLQFDLLRSFANGTENFYDCERVDGALLPLLASWTGWETNHALGFDKQRSEINYAPHYFRTTGIAANLRATVNRMVSWNARVKEFVHNVFLSTAPAQLTVWEKVNRDDLWQPADLVSLDVAYDGRPATLQTKDRRQWLFHHARQSAPLSSRPEQRTATLDYWHIWYKLFDQDEWLSAHHVSFAGTINKYPTAIEDADGRVCVFWTGYQTTDAKSIPEIASALLAAGRPARPAKAKGTAEGPLSFTDGNFFDVKVTMASRSFTRRVTIRPEHFQNIATATLAEIVELLNLEIPDVLVTVEDGVACLTTDAMGSAAKLEFPVSPVATKLGLTTAITGDDAAAATMLGGTEPFALAEGDALTIRMDDRISRVVTFSGSDFNNIGKAKATEVVAAINRVLPGVARLAGARVELTSTAAGAASSLVVETVAPFLFSLALNHQTDLDRGAISEPVRAAFRLAGANLSASGVKVSIQDPGTNWLITDGPRRYLAKREEGKLNVHNPALAGPKLGFGIPLPPPPSPAPESEPAVLKDSDGGIWLFWSSRRNGTWNIWYNRFDGKAKAWDTPRALTTGSNADCEPAVLFVPSPGGRIWVFWSRKKNDGLWNIFYRTTANLTLSSAFSDADSKEIELLEVPAPIPAAPSTYDNREPNAIVQKAGADAVELYFSSNRANGWHTWSKVITTTNQGTDLQINSGHVTHRAPAVLKLTDKLKKLYFRSNESQVYTSALYPAAQTIDARYSGSTTVDTRNPSKISLRRNIQDIQAYTYDTLKANDNWYARDTVGIYLLPDTVDQSLILHRRDQMESVLRSFLPIQVRTVFIVDQVFQEFIYTYDDPKTEKPFLIREHMVDTISSEVLWGPLKSAVRGPAETGFYQAGFHWLRTFDGVSGDGLLPDLSQRPPALSFRLLLRDVTEPVREVIEPEGDV